MTGIVKGLHALNEDPVRSFTRDAGSHCREREHEIADLGVARGVQDLSFAARERRRHQGRLGCADRWRGQDNAPAAQATFFNSRVDVAGFDIDLSAERIQGLEVQVDRPRADGAPSRHGYARRTEAREQRRQDENASTHAADHVVGCLRAAGSRCIEHQSATGAARGDDAELLHQSKHGVDVGYFGDVRQLQPSGAEKRRGDLR